MGKSIPLGRKLKYPITIKKLLKRPGETFKKQDPIFQYTFTWFQEVGDPFAETWQEKQTTIADWESPADGTLVKWQIKEGMEIERDAPCMEITEECGHEVQFAGLCAVCGKDMNETNWASDTVDASNAMINMIHDQTLLSVSMNEASRAESQLQRRLLNARKLSLVVDLDQTIIHAAVDPTVGDWQRDVNSPNHEAVKDVKAFQLIDDGPRGLTNGCWYYIKMRPGLAQFLTKVATMFELHVYTMGTRAYAQNIAKIVDPDHKLFGDRIISRDENGSLTAKSLSRIFPVDTKMVVIIDDRADVWPRNRPNLIKVVPYDFFVGIGDINSSYLPKLEPAAPKKTDIKLSLPKRSPPIDEVSESKNAQPKAQAAGEASEENEKESGSDRMSTLQEFVSMSGGDDPNIRAGQAEERENTLEKQLKERPLLHLQEKLDQQDEETASNGDSTEVGDAPEHHHQRHHLLNDDDQELTYLESHLTRLHEAFYKEYDESMAKIKGGRVAELKSSKKRKMPLLDEFGTVPDIGEVMPKLKAKTLEGTLIVLTGIVPNNVDPMKSDIVIHAMTFGAEFQTRVSRKVTHLVVSSARSRTEKVKDAIRYPNIKIVNEHWLMNSLSKWKREDESLYLIDAYSEDREPLPSETTHSSQDGTLSDLENDEHQDSQEEEDAEGVMPDELDNPLSPIDGLKGFDWGGVGDELDEFLGSDADDSDTGSDASESSSYSRRSSFAKHQTRKHSRDSDGGTDEESNVVKKQRLSRVRSTGLKTVDTSKKTSNSHPGLPTPDITGGEELDDQVDLIPTANAEEDDAFDDDDFEAAMEAAFDDEDA